MQRNCNACRRGFLRHQESHGVLTSVLTSCLTLQEDVFTVLLPDVGPLTHLGVRSDGSGQHPAWHLEKVCVQGQVPGSHALDTPQGQQQQQLHAGAPVWFSAQRWLDAAHGLEMLLPALAEDPGLNLVPYRVQVYTSDIK
jgi:hypothetical protein